MIIIFVGFLFVFDEDGLFCFCFCFCFFVQKVGANEDSEAAANTQSKGTCSQGRSGQGHQ
jgi:hypothetical protein